MKTLLKSEINEEIASLIGFHAPHMSTGSTESKDLFIQINEILGLGIDSRKTKPQLAQAIVQASGAVWDANCESAGGTVTRVGLSRVLSAVQFFVCPPS